ncbi:hypothetical protein Salat_0212600, partial [Sesamum alatum]
AASSGGCGSLELRPERAFVVPLVSGDDHSNTLCSMWDRARGYTPCAVTVLLLTACLGTGGAAMASGEYDKGVLRSGCKALDGALWTSRNTLVFEGRGQEPLAVANLARRGLQVFDRNPTLDPG